MTTGQPMPSKSYQTCRHEALLLGVKKSNDPLQEVRYDFVQALGNMLF